MTEKGNVHLPHQFGLRQEAPVFRPREQSTALDKALSFWQAVGDIIHHLCSTQITCSGAP